MSFLLMLFSTFHILLFTSEKMRLRNFLNVTTSVTRGGRGRQGRFRANVKIQTEDESELLEEPKTEAEKKWHLSACNDNSLPGLVVFQAIAKKYPENANVADSIEKFKKLS